MTNAALADAVAGHRLPFEQAIEHAEQVQEAYLLDLLARNADTATGRRHGFAAIRSISQYQQRLELSDYETLKEPVRSMAMGQADLLFAGQATAFEMTGGSTAGSKLIPFSEHGLADLRRALFAWLDDLFNNHPGLTNCKAYWAVSPVTRRQTLTPSGIPIGMPDAAYLGERAGNALLQGLCIPPQLSQVSDYQAWRRQTALHLLATSDLGLVSVWSPSFLQLLLSFIRDHFNDLCHSLEDRTRAVAIAGALDKGDFTTIWPDLQLVSCWADASSPRQRIVFAGPAPSGHVAAERIARNRRRCNHSNDRSP